ncbi:MAG: hypothetical protein M1834_008802 [Cirrosporium novae-zelandiae]|nr:MAG: hypothetical protein M1834_008802 [Cirrosporium novae-zelandiae]
MAGYRFKSKAIPPPRQKSCNACIQAKRRCDLQIPTCSRCTKRNLTCNYLYPPERPRSLTKEPPQNTSILASPELTRVDLPNPTELKPSSQPFNFNMDLGLENAPTAFNPFDSFSTMFQTSWQDGPKSLTPRVPNTYPLNLFENQNPDISFVESPDRLDALLRDNGIPIGKSLEPRVTATTAPPVELLEGIAVSTSTPYGPIEEYFTDATSRVNYSTEVIKAIPSLLVKKNQTEWMHPVLYKSYMPPSIRDAQAACSLYVNKNSENEASVFRFIDIKVNELVASEFPHIPIDMLARVQAILLYQIIRLHDGNIRQRANGEAQNQLLLEWAHDLHKFITRQDIESSSSPDNPTSIPQSLESWALFESARRTSLFCSFFLSQYNILKFGHCDQDLCPFANSTWTASAHLWNAQTTFDFKIAWNNHPRFVVKDLNIKDFLENAKADDVDGYTKLIMVTCIGTDNVKEWLLEKGEI